MERKNTDVIVEVHKLPTTVPRNVGPPPMLVIHTAAIENDIHIAS